MSNVVELVQPVPTKDDSEFVTDLARYRENLLDEKTIRTKYRLADDVLEKLGADDELIRAVEAELARRVRNGDCKREKAQLLVVAAPDVLSGILLDSAANPRHRIDSAKELNSFASNGPGQSAPAADRFQITINLGADFQLKFDKSRAVDVDDIDPFNDTGTGVIAAIAKKPTESGGGEPI